MTNNLKQKTINNRLRSVDNVAAWQLCCGCGVCAYVCPDEIEMIDTLEYGRRPRLRNGKPQNNSCPEALQVCPGIELTRNCDPNTPGLIKELLPAWGPVLGVWEGYAADPQIRFEGSSGGLATALAAYAIEKAGMYGALHITARQDVPYLNHTVLSRDRQGLLAGAGSRYAPASPCDGLPKIEEAAGPCVFIGKPCDVAAVRKAAVLRPSLGEKIGLTIAFFCAGTPSTNGTLTMLKQMGVNNPSCVRSLRYRGRGWPGLATVEYQDETGKIQQRQLTYEQSWGDILQKYRQWRCYICPDHIGEFADIAVADAWHRPVGEHQPGRSVLIARTERGKNFIQKAMHDDYVKIKAVGSDILPACRPGQAAAQGNLWARIKTLKVLRIPTPDYNGFDLLKLYKSQLSTRQKIQSVISTIKRIFIKKLYQKRMISPYRLLPFNE